jgi:hypothetical protein
VRTLLAAALVLALSGCLGIRSYHPLYGDRALVEQQRGGELQESIAVAFEFRSRGAPSRALTEQYRETVISIVRECDVFSAVRRADSPADLSVSIVVNNAVDSLVGPLAQGLLSELTLGFIGTSVTDGYVISADFRKGAADVRSATYRYAVVTRSGLLKPGAGTSAEYHTFDDAFRDVLRHFTREWLADLQRAGAI